jgi:hypothetical protein
MPGPQILQLGSKLGRAASTHLLLPGGASDRDRPVGRLEIAVEIVEGEDLHFDRRLRDGSGDRRGGGTSSQGDKRDTN